MADLTIQFGADEGAGALTGWDAQNNTSDAVYERARVLSKDGNETKGKLHSLRTDVSTPYTANVAGSAPAIPATLGGLLNSNIATSFNLSTQANEFASMTITAHNHTTNAHAASPALKSVAHGITLRDGFGATDFIGGTAGDNASAVSGSITIACQHKDENGITGDHACGNNYDGMLEADTDWLGVPTSTSDGTWDVVKVGTYTDNQGFKHTKVNATKALTMA